MEVSGLEQRDKVTITTGVHGSGVHCDPCLLLNKNENAEHYCVDCDEFFCNTCSSTHKLFKLSRRHEILSRDDMPRQKLASAEENSCFTHSGEMLKYFCEVHKNFFCTVCVTLEHKNCSVEFIDDIAVNYEKSPEYRSLTEKISSLLHQLKDIKKTSHKHTQDLQRVYTEFVSDVKTFRSEINSLLDSMEKVILKEAQDERERDVKAVQTVSTMCDTVSTDVNEIATKLEQYKICKQQRQMVIFAKKAEEQICECEKKMAKMHKQNKIRHYLFHKNEKMLYSLLSMNSLGTVVDRKEASGLFQF